MLIICVIPYCKKYGQMAVLGAITSLFGPCIVVNEFSMYFPVTAISSSLIYMSALAGLSLMIYFDNCQDKIMLKTEWPTAFKMNNTTRTGALAVRLSLEPEGSKVTGNI